MERTLTFTKSPCPTDSSELLPMVTNLEDDDGDGFDSAMMMIKNGEVLPNGQVKTFLTRQNLVFPTADHHWTLRHGPQEIPP